MQTETRLAELRADIGDSRILRGTVMPYGSLAILPFGRERFEVGSFVNLDGDLTLNRMHVRGAPVARTTAGSLTLIDSPDALRMVAVLPETRLANEVLDEVRAGLLTGLSVEFAALQERLVGDVRSIQRARLNGLAVVDSGAYPEATVHARWAAAGRQNRRRRLWL